VTVGGAVLSYSGLLPMSALVQGQQNDFKSDPSVPVFPPLLLVMLLPFVCIGAAFFNFFLNSSATFQFNFKIFLFYFSFCSILDLFSILIFFQFCFCFTPF